MHYLRIHVNNGKAVLKKRKFHEMDEEFDDKITSHFKKIKNHLSRGTPFFDFKSIRDEQSIEESLIEESLIEESYKDLFLDDISCMKKQMNFEDSSILDDYSFLDDLKIQEDVVDDKISRKKSDDWDEIMEMPNYLFDSNHLSNGIHKLSCSKGIRYDFVYDSSYLDSSSTLKMILPPINGENEIRIGKNIIVRRLSS
jgi:hypothetical protein